MTDIQRYLKNEPVVAPPPTNLYRLQKLVRRNGSPAISLLIGLGSATWPFLEKSRASRRAVSAERESRVARANETKQPQQAERTAADWRKP
jgi:hypothetical protein